MTLSTGDQLKAARALASIEQAELAKLAGVSISTVRNVEASGSELITANLKTLRKIQKAMEALGIEFLNHDAPGVRLHPGEK